MENLLIGIGIFRSGTAYNVLADHAELEGTVRSLDPKLRIQTIERIERLAKNTAAIYGGEAEVEWGDHYTPVLINDKASTKEAQKVAFSLFGEKNVITESEASLGGDDMAVFINRVPGCYASIGSCDPNLPESAHSLHHPSFDIGEDCLVTSVSLTVCYALAYMNGEV